MGTQVHTDTAHIIIQMLFNLCVFKHVVLTTHYNVRVSSWVFHTDNVGRGHARLQKDV